MERKVKAWIFSPYPNPLPQAGEGTSFVTDAMKKPSPACGRGLGFVQNYPAGFTFLELLLAVAVTAILLAGVYGSYLIVARQYTRLVAIQEVQEAGIPVLQLLMRDIRMAGYKAVDDTLQAPLGAIATPVTITDSGNACCDSITVIYDKDITTRQRISYSVQAQANPARNVLYMTMATWNGTAWVTSVALTPVAEYIEDMQFSGSDPDTNGNPRLVDLNLVFRSKTAQLQNINYQKPSYNIGNYALTSNDPYYRDEFSGTIKIRNVR